MVPDTVDSLGLCCQYREFSDGGVDLSVNLCIMVVEKRQSSLIRNGQIIKRSLRKRVAELNAEAEQIQAEMMELDIAADIKSGEPEADTRKERVDYG